MFKPTSQYWSSNQSKDFYKPAHDFGQEQKKASNAKIKELLGNDVIGNHSQKTNKYARIS